VDLNPKTLVVYQAFGYQTGRLNRYYMLNPDKETFHLVDGFDDQPDSGAAASSIKKLVHLDHLFAKYVTGDEASFARELYMNREELESMIANGMYVGNHGYDHSWLSQLSPSEQGREIDISLAFLKDVGAPTDRWVMCYPYGDYNESLLQVMEARHCSVGLTTKPGISRMERSNSLTLERLNTNDFPKSAEGF
jgi:hypothetical protein